MSILLGIDTGGTYTDACYIGGVGGDGILTNGSSVAVVECSLFGGRGGIEDPAFGVGGTGGSGVRALGGRVWVMGSAGTGGDGGIGTDFIIITGGGGGGHDQLRGAHRADRSAASCLDG